MNPYKSVDKKAKQIRIILLVREIREWLIILS